MLDQRRIMGINADARAFERLRECSDRWKERVKTGCEPKSEWKHHAPGVEYRNEGMVIDGRDLSGDTLWFDFFDGFSIEPYRPVGPFATVQ